MVFLPAQSTNIYTLYKRAELSKSTVTLCVQPGQKKLVVMRLLLLAALSFLAVAAQVCNGRPQVNEDVTSTELSEDIVITTESIQDAAENSGTELAVIDSLKDISKTLKEKFIALGDKIRGKLEELKHAAGARAQAIKEQLKSLKQQLKDSFRALKQKVQGFFNKGQYASFGDRAIEIFGKVVEIRDRLNEFVKGVKGVTADKLKKMQELAKQLRKEIKIKVQELLHGSSESQVALYDASDEADEEDDNNEAYVIATLKDISKCLKEKFIILVEKLQQKFAELKQVGGEHAEKIEEELRILKERVTDAREALKQKVQELFKPAQYASFGEHAREIFVKLSNLRWKLNKFLQQMKNVTGEKLEKLKVLIKETRQEIKERIQELLYGSSNYQTALYHASDDAHNEKDDAYVISTLKDISKSLKEKFLILVENLKQKFAELKQAGGEHAEKIKGQLRILKEKVTDAREALKQKVQELFKPAQYASIGEHAREMFAKLGKLREKLNQFLQDVKDVTGEKLELRELIKEARQEITEKVQELIDSRSDETALYQADDTDDDHEAYIINTLKDISKTLKEKFQVLGDKIAQKVQDIKTAAGQRAAMLKEQLQELKRQLGDAASALKKKVFEMVQPGQSAQYGTLDNVSSAFSEKLTALQKKLKNFLDDVKNAVGEKWIKMRETIRELRKEIKQGIRDLLHGKSEMKISMVPESTSAMPL